MLGSLVFFMVPKAGLEPARRELRLILSFFLHGLARRRFTGSLETCGFPLVYIELCRLAFDYGRLSKSCQIIDRIFRRFRPWFVRCLPAFSQCYVHTCPL